MHASSERPTMRDVARLAGVSTATVSHVINGTGAITAAPKHESGRPLRRLTTSRTCMLASWPADEGNRLDREFL
jgi:Bacterial regulatory proteins, lacI family